MHLKLRRGSLSSWNAKTVFFFLFQVKIYSINCKINKNIKKEREKGEDAVCENELMPFVIKRLNERICLIHVCTHIFFPILSRIIFLLLIEFRNNKNISSFKSLVLLCRCPLGGSSSTLHRGAAHECDVFQKFLNQSDELYMSRV